MNLWKVCYEVINYLTERLNEYIYLPLIHHCDAAAGPLLFEKFDMIQFKCVQHINKDTSA